MWVRKLSEHLAPTLLQRIAPQPVVALPHSQPLTPKRCDKVRTDVIMLDG